MTDAAIVPRRWTKPPFIRRPWLRWTLGLAAAAYLALALGTTEVNWTRVWAGLPRGLQFLAAFFPPDFTSRWSEIVDGISESLWMTVVSSWPQRRRAQHRAGAGLLLLPRHPGGHAQLSGGDPCDFLRQAVRLRA